MGVDSRIAIGGDLSDPIAIVGIGCRFPGGVNSPADFWEFLVNRGDGIIEVPSDRWDLKAYYDASREMPGTVYTRKGGFLTNIDQFDPAFFGISPREADYLDPQQRLLLEVTWEAMEDAGIVPMSLRGQDVGVYVGLFTHDFENMHNSSTEHELLGPHSGTGSSTTIAANRLSYAYDFTGPSMVVDTACSSSLVALHLACDHLRSGRCESGVAIAAGVNVMLRPEMTMTLCKASMLSPDGYCKSFDAAANGYARAEGAATVVLKKLSEAQAAGDPIYAVIRGTAVNQDGCSDGLTVPGIETQKLAVIQALKASEVSAAEIGYVEAHGTGTAVGDPTEAASLGSALSKGRSETSPCIIGSVKSNIGHTESAAGLAGLIKTSLMLKYGQILPNLHFHTPNPQISFETLKLRVPTTVETWPEGYKKRLAGVNSFGFGGTNAHAILEAPEPDSNHQRLADQPVIIPLSAQNEDALKALAQSYIERFENSDAQIVDIAYSAVRHRQHLSCRLAVVADSRKEFIAELKSFLKGSGVASVGNYASNEPERTVFVFSGMGQQFAGMGRALMEESPVFRAMIERCDALFLAHTDQFSICSELTASAEKSRIDENDVAHACIFSLQVALAELLKSQGVSPDAIVGHSSGEVAAAYAAGLLSLDDAVYLSFHRSRLQDLAVGQGGMLAVGLPLLGVKEYLTGFGDQVSVAAINSQNAITLSGTQEALEAIAVQLDAAGVFNRTLKVEVPYHSSAMDPILPELRVLLEKVKNSTPHTPLISSVTGEWANETSIDSNYWTRNVREPVQFEKAIQTLVSEEYTTFVEISAHPVLAIALKENLRNAERKGSVVSTLNRTSADFRSVLKSRAQLYCCGHVPQCPEGRFIPLPNYPWQRKTYWVESEASKASRAGRRDASSGGLLQPASHPLLGNRLIVPAPTWNAVIDLRRLSYLKDHVVQGTVLYPAAAFIEMALAIGDGRSLFDFSILTPLALRPETSVTLQSAEEKNGVFAIHSQAGEGVWTLHAKGRFEREITNDILFEPDEIVARCTQKMNTSEILARQQRIGLEYGPAFQCLESAVTGEDEAFVQLRSSAMVLDHEYGLHPTLLDACFQAMVLIPGKGTYLPSGAKKIRLVGAVDGAASVYVRMTTRSAQQVVGNVFLLDTAGHVLAEVSGLDCRRVPDRSHSSEYIDQMLYMQEWVPSTLEEKPVEPINFPVLLLADTDSFSKKLLGRLDGAVLVRRGERSLQISASEFLVNPASPAALDGLLSTIFPDASHPPFIINLWHSSPECSSAEGAVDSCSWSLAIFQALLRREWKAPPRLWQVVQGAQSSGEFDEGALFQSALWGLGRVMITEHPQIQTRMVGLCSDPSDEDVSLFLQDLVVETDEDELAYWEGVRYVRRVQRSFAAQDRLCTPEAYRLASVDGMLSRLVWAETERKIPAPSEVEIKIISAGLNFKDVAAYRGLLRYMNDGDLGQECAGIISAVGSDVEGFRVGDEVMALVMGGGFSSHVVIDQNALIHKPAAMTFDEAAAFPLAAATVHYSFAHLAQLKPGERVLIHTASGAVGLVAIQYAQKIGAEVFATAGTQEKREFLKTLNVSYVGNSRDTRFAEEIRSLLGGQLIDVVLNTLPASTLSASISLLKPGTGRLVDLSNIHYEAELDLQNFKTGISFFAFDLREIDKLNRGLLEQLLVELRELFGTEFFEPIRQQVFSASEVLDALDLMKVARHVGKIVLSMCEPPSQILPTRGDLEVDSDGTYLIVGGLGGFGLATARWLIDCGARHLVLTSRSGASRPELMKQVEELRLTGAHVSVVQSDVSSRQDVKQLLGEIRKGVNPLRGVVLAAMVLEDGPLEAMTTKQLQRVMEPKVAGAWNLHAETIDDSLDLFICFSSFVSLVGNRNQGNYAAGNMFLDHLCMFRQAQGLPALSIGWGPIASAGYLTSHAEVADSFRRQGAVPVELDQAWKVIRYALNERWAHVVAVTVDWVQLAQYSMSVAQSPRFSGLLKGHAESQTEVRQIDLAGNSKERAKQLQGILSMHVAGVLGIIPEELNPDITFDALGLDSLMAVELNVRISQSIGIEVATINLLQGGMNLSRLAVLISEESEKLGLTQLAEARTDSMLGKPMVEVATPDHQSAVPATFSFEQTVRYQEFEAQKEQMEQSSNFSAFFRTTESANGAVVKIDGCEVVNYSSYNYLSLSSHLTVSTAAQIAIDKYGTSAGASRIASGELPVHRDLETALSDLLGTEDALVFVGGYATNETVIGHLLEPGDLLLYDSLIHASIQAGGRLSGAEMRAFPHNSWEALDRILKQERSRYRNVMIVIEGVYSMDGDIPDLPRFIEVKQNHGTMLMVDEAHSVGVLGETGRGIGEHFGVEPFDVDLWMGTLSKSFASCGGYIAGSAPLIEFLKYTTPGFVFSVGMPPANAAAAQAAIEVMLAEPDRVGRLHERAELFLSLVKEKGLNCGSSNGSAVVPIILGDSAKCMALHRALFEKGIYVLPVLYPAVPESAARLRFFITEGHTDEQIRETVECLAELV